MKGMCYNDGWIKFELLNSNANGENYSFSTMMYSFMIADCTLTIGNGIAMQSSVIPVTGWHAINSSRALPAEITDLVFTVHQAEFKLYTGDKWLE